MAKKTVKKGAKQAGGAAELQAFQTAIQNLKTTGLALAKAARANRELQKKSSLHSAVAKMQDTAERLAKAIPLDPPPTTVSQ